MHRSPRMRSGWIKVSLLVFAVATALLYLSSIKREVHTHSERLQRAHHNDSIRGQGMLNRMDKMEADINRLRESKSRSNSCFFFCSLTKYKIRFQEKKLDFMILTTQ